MKGFLIGVAGVLALVLAVGLARTRLTTVASLVALVVPSVLVAILGWEGVQHVADVSPIPASSRLAAISGSRRPERSWATPRPRPSRRATPGSGAGEEAQAIAPGGRDSRTI
jgi:hypothetical protein